MWNNCLPVSKTVNTGYMWFVCLVVKLCLTLGNPKDSSLSGFSVRGIFQARILERVAISFSKMWLWLTICILFLILSRLRASLLHWSIWPASYKKKTITGKYTPSYFVPHFLAPTKKNYFLLFSIKFKGIVDFLRTLSWAISENMLCLKWEVWLCFPLFLLP